MPIKLPGVRPIKIIATGDIPRCKELIGFARDQLAILEKQMSFQKLNEGNRSVKPFPGTHVIAVSSFNHREVSIYVEPIVPVIRPEVIEILEEEEVSANIVAMAHKWGWDSSRPSSMGGLPEDSEKSCTVVGDTLFYDGVITDTGKIVFTSESELTYPSVGPYPSSPYRVSDFSQVRYSLGDKKYLSLCMSEYEITNVSGNSWGYYCVDVIGEGSNVPSISFLIEKTNYIDMGTCFCDPAEICTIGVDAALSTDLSTLYLIEYVRAPDNSYRAYVDHSTYENDPETYLWTNTASGNIDCSTMYVYGNILVDRYGQIGTFSYSNPAVTWHSETSTYESACDKYLFSIPLDDFVLTTNEHFGSKVVDIAIKDYEIVKYSSIETIVDITSYNFSDYNEGDKSFWYDEKRTTRPAMSTSFLGTISDHGTLSYYMSGNTWTKPRIDGVWQGYQCEYTVVGHDHQTPSIQPSSWRRTIIADVYGDNYPYFYDNYTYDVVEGDTTTGNPTAYQDTVDDGCLSEYSEVFWSGLYLDSPVTLAGGCHGPGTDVWELTSVGEDFQLHGGSVWHDVHIDSFIIKSFIAGTLFYPPLNISRSFEEIRNCFMTCDQESGMFFYGALILSNDQVYDSLGRQVPYKGTTDTTVIDDAAEWIIYHRFNGVTKDITNIIEEKYAADLLSDTTPITEPPTVYDPPYTPPWLEVPATYTNLESFFGIMFWSNYS